MAIKSDLPATAKIFCGEDKSIEFTIFDADGITPLDVAAWTFEWVVRAVYPRRLTTPARIPPECATATTTPDPALRKESGDGIAVTGTFNADPDVNTQRVVVTIADTDTESLTPGTYNHALKRLDDGFETILSFGEFVLRKAAAV
jgi:hypothetical protein